MRGLGGDLRPLVVLAVGIAMGATAMTWVLLGWAPWGMVPRLAAVVGGGLVVAGIGVWGGRRLLVAPRQADLAALAEAIGSWTAEGAVRVPEVADPALVPLATGLARVLSATEVGWAEQARRSRIFDEVMALAPVGLAILDEDQRIRSSNAGFAAMFDLRGDPLGKRPLEVVPSVEIHLVVQQAREGGRADRTFATATRDLQAQAVRMSDGVLLWVEDVTGRRDAQRSRTDFVANVSHELRTPLAAILGYLEALGQDIDRIPEDLAPLLQTADRNARRLRDLFEDLLRLHRVEARRHELPLAQHRLAPLLDAAVEPAREQSQAAGLCFAVDCSDDLTAWLNPDALRTIVVNLAGNAVAYTPPGGRIDITARRRGAGVEIVVQDDGIGIARRHHERVFERFYRVDAARSRRAGGTGLGLAIARHYALACGSHLGLQAEEGEGSCFTLVLPDR